MCKRDSQVRQEESLLSNTEVCSLYLCMWEAGSRCIATSRNCCNRSALPNLVGRCSASDTVIMIRTAKDPAEFKALLAEAGDKLVVVDFSAMWCGPCRKIAPVFEALSEDYENVVFVKVDVDEAEELSQECGIRAMPTFQFFRNGSKIAELMGADEKKLKQKLSDHAKTD